MKVKISTQPKPAWQWKGEMPINPPKWIKDSMVLHGILSGHLSLSVDGYYFRMAVNDILVETFKTIWPTSIRLYPSSAIGKSIKIVKEKK